MIEPASNLVDLMEKLTTFVMLHGSELPEHTRAAIVASASHPSPVDRIVDTAEALYASKSELSAEGRTITAQLAQFAAMNGWHGMGTRGLAIPNPMNRTGGSAAPAGDTWPPAADDPEPLERFAEPTAEDTPEEAPEAA